MVRGMCGLFASAKAPAGYPATAMNSYQASREDNELDYYLLEEVWVIIVSHEMT
jgi:hypothetical protein